MNTATFTFADNITTTPTVPLSCLYDLLRAQLTRKSNPWSGMLICTDLADPKSNYVIFDTFSKRVVKSVQNVVSDWRGCRITKLRKDGNLLVCYQYSICVADINTCEIITEFDMDGTHIYNFWELDNDKIITVHEFDLQLWDMESGSFIQSFLSCNVDTCPTLRMSDDNVIVAADAMFNLIDMKTRTVKQLDVQGLYYQSAIYEIKPGVIVCQSHGQRKFHIIDIYAEAILFETEVSMTLFLLYGMSNGTFLVYSKDNSTLMVYNEKCKCINQIEVTKDAIQAESNEPYVRAVCELEPGVLMVVANATIIWNTKVGTKEEIETNNLVVHCAY
jgi:hypothetical protein